MYFSKFPLISYTFDGGVTRFLATDIFTRVKSDYDNVKTSLAYDEYDIRDGETPEALADKLYNDSALHWVILIINEVIDPRWDWPLDTNSLQAWIADKYGSNINAVRYYVNSVGDVVHSSFAGTKTPVTNYDYEIAQNESKRRIRILKPRFVATFVTSFMDKMQNGR